jgi:RNA polymerase sigma factor (sigma-70 family)
LHSFKSFEEIYLAHCKLVYNVALQYVLRIEDAEEITQDVFVKVYEKYHSFRNESELRTWIYRITINQSLDFLKAKKSLKRWNPFGILDLDHPDTNIQFPEFNHPGIELEQKEALKSILTAIYQLPENQKTAIILLRIEGRSTKEVANIMDLGDKAVESLYQRAKKNLEIILTKNKGI